MMRPKSKRIFSAMLMLTLLALLVTGCSSNTSSPAPAPAAPAEPAEYEQHPDFVLRIGWSGSLCEAPLHMAVEKGFFDEVGLKYELIKLAPGTAFDAVTANQIDASFGLLASLIQPLSNGLPIKITSGLHTGCDKVLVKPDSGIAKPADFVGKKVGVTSYTASPYIYAKRVLADAGVDVTAESGKVEFVVYAVADLPIALQNGAVDAIAMNDPTATIAANADGLNIVFDSAKDAPYKDQYCCSAYVRENIAADYPDIALKYTVAMQKAAAWAQNNQDEVAEIQVANKWVAGDAKVNAGVLKTFNYIPSYEGAYEIFGITAPQLQEVGMLDKDVDTDALLKNSFHHLNGLEYE